MKYAFGMKQAVHPETEQRAPILPRWIFQARAPETLGSTTRGSNDPEDAGFASGATLALLHVVLHDPITDVPSELLRNRLALRAAVSCLKLEGRAQTEAEIRDAFFLASPGDAMGPAGDMLALWRRVAAISLKHAGWRERLQTVLPEEMQEPVADWLDRTEDARGNPVAAAAAILTGILKAFARQEAVALLCADVVLAQRLGWDRPLPLFGLHLRRKTLREAAEGEAIQIACHEAVAHAAQDAVRLAHDLARRTADLRSIEPRLRTKGSHDAVRLFLSEDAVYAPAMLTPTIRGSSTPMTARSARRLCDRLVELGVVRELTGRKTFRLYGAGS